ncbi:MAG: thioredoxin [Deltaproteobacteria bacterium]
MASPLVYRCDRCGAFNRLSLLVPGRSPVCGKCKVDLDLSGHPAALTDATFELAIGAPVPVLVDFWATWCGPCRAMAPAYEELGRKLAGQLIVAKVDVDASPNTASRFNIQSIPTVILFRGGRELERAVGARSLSQLEQFARAGSLAI